MTIRSISLDKLRNLTPYAAFRVGLYEDARRMWMHIARDKKSRKQNFCDALKYARDAHRKFIQELNGEAV